MEVINNVSISQWNEIIGKCDEATFFATPEWAQVLNKTYGYKIAAKIFILGDGTKVLLPLMKTGKHQKFFGQYLSVPFHNYGGLFSERTLQENEIELMIKKLKGWLPIDIIVVPHPFSENKPPKANKINQYSTRILDLSNNFNQFWQNYHNKDQDRKVRKARKTRKVF